MHSIRLLLSLEQFGESAWIELDFLPSEMVAIRKALEPEEQKAAKERQRAGKDASGQGGGRGRKKPGGKLPQGFESEPKTRDKVAQYAGISGKTLEKAMEVVEAAEAEPEKYGPLAEEMDRTRRQNRHRATRMVCLSLF